MQTAINTFFHTNSKSFASLTQPFFTAVQHDCGNSLTIENNFFAFCTFPRAAKPILSSFTMTAARNGYILTMR